MKTNTRRMILMGLVGVTLLAPRASTETTPTGEYEVKAALVYSFLKFVVGGRFQADDKSGAAADPNEVLRIGILGKVPVPGAFAGLQGKLVKNKRIEVRYFKGFEDYQDDEQQIPAQHPLLADLRRGQVLFVCPSEKPFLARLLPPLQKDGLLLVGDVPGFLEAGGIINLKLEENKVRFEVNLAAARRGNVQIRSSLLRLAVRTLEHDALEEPETAPR